MKKPKGKKHNKISNRPFETRKQSRKLKRLEKKQRRNIQHSGKPVELDKSHDVQYERNYTKQSKTDANNQDNEFNKFNSEKKKLDKQMKQQRLSYLRNANKDEDRIIKSLEKKLKMNKRKADGLPSSFVSEGLDYVLELCDQNTSSRVAGIEREFQNENDEFSKDIELIKNTRSVRQQDKSKKCFNEVDDDFSEVESDIESTFSDISDNNNNDISSSDDGRVKRKKKKVSEELSEEEDEYYSDEGNSNDESIDNKDKDGNKTWEDIYGRVRDKDGNIIKEEESSKYIPPQLRKNIKASSVDRERLTKRMKGLLNRLTENNMHSVSNEMERVYMEHSRNDANETLMSLIKESLISRVLSPEKMVIHHVMLIAILHANIAYEIGANVLQNMIDLFHNQLIDNCHNIQDKTIDNTVVIICQMYHFKIFGSSLMYGILDKLADEFQEKHIELILIILKSVGFVLRKDDAQKLKQLIIKLQNKANESNELKQSARVRFMLDTLLAVKNNNMSKLSQYDPTYVHHLKKVVKSILRSGKSIVQLNVTLHDLLNVEKRGRWWIVGSAWNTDALNTSSVTQNEEIKSFAFSKEIMNLAKKEKMNTDLRKNIFCILMTAEDCTDAFEKLMKCELKGQEAQVIHVIMHCVLREKCYNPYYGYLANKLCCAHRKYQLAIQFAAWDRFKEINNLTSKQCRNLSMFLSYLFTQEKLCISILKVLHFTELNNNIVRFLRQLLLSILLTDNEQTVKEVFHRISKAPTLHILRQGLQLFLHHFILKNIEKCDLSDEKLSLLPKRVEIAQSAMTNID